jgi:excisionase family DNA binding protein
VSIFDTIRAQVEAAKAPDPILSELQDLRRQVAALVQTPPATAPDPDALLTVRQAAEILGCSPEALYARVERQQIPCIRPTPKSLRFRRSDLLKTAPGVRPSRSKGAK